MIFTVEIMGRKNIKLLNNWNSQCLFRIFPRQLGQARVCNKLIGREVELLEFFILFERLEHVKKVEQGQLDI